MGSYLFYNINSFIPNFFNNYYVSSISFIPFKKGVPSIIFKSFIANYDIRPSNNIPIDLLVANECIFIIISGILKFPYSSSNIGIKLSDIISEIVLLHPPENTANLSPILTFVNDIIFTYILFIESLF